ncbi:MAG: deoxyhypusine synthase [Candidatus Brockarchaeota archaeon]|nr:deoxyhypusine synthase [Candidatus Brockarchaeota archaeon]
MKDHYLKRKLESIEVKKKSISNLLSEMAKTGFQGRRLGEVFQAWEEMLRDENVTIFMGFAGSMSTTGQWKIVRWLIEKRFIDVLVSTGANISEDILEAMGFSYWQGSHLVSDEELYRLRIDRFYDVYADEMEYRKMESLIGEFTETLNPSYAYSSREYLYLFGRFLNEKGINSIVAAAYRNRVPVFSPGLVDSGYGIANVILRYKKNKKIIVDQMKDFEEIVKIGAESKKTGVIYVGGGVPKDFIQLVAVALEFVKGKDQPHEYAIQITTDSPQWGGLSGATFEEAISWGKESPRGRNVICYCDATIALPIVVHALAERVEKRINPPDFSLLLERT